MRQVGGKYCSFVCPFCGNEKALFKMTQNAGWCDKCGTNFYNFESLVDMPVRPGMDFPDMVGLMEIEYR